MNYFSPRSVAARYAAGRPFFHPLVVGKIKEHLRLAEPLARALDVACGTGQSAVALQEIASHVVATDVAAEMLAHATRASHVSYVRAASEWLPFHDESFDLMTVSMALHWFDRARFFAEARRLLRAGRYLVVYDNSFLAEMKENPAYKSWSRANYGTRFPPPPRNDEPLTDESVKEHGFTFAHREPYSNEVQFSVDQLVTYLTTHSNVIASVEYGTESLERV